MTVPSTTRRAGPFTGTGALTSYPFTFKVFAAADLAVTVADEDGLESTLVLDSSFLVTLNGDQETTPGGSVQYAVSGIATALPAGYSLAITGEGLEYEQTADLPQGGNFNPVVIENALDRQMMLTQLLRDIVTRALQLSVTTPDGVDATLPTPVANNFIGWDSGGVGLRNIDPNTLATIVAFASWQSETFNGTGAQTQFTLAADPGSIANTDVSVGGVTQRPNIDYTLSGLAITFTTAPYAGTDNVLVRYGQALPEGTSTLETDLANASDVSKGSAKVGQKRSATGAVATTIRQWVEAQMFNALADFGGSASSITSAIMQAAIDALPSSGGIIFVPKGAHTLASTVNVNKPCTIVGEGFGSIIVTSHATADVFNVTAQGVTICDLAITASVTRTAGYFVNFSGGANENNYSRVNRCLMTQWFNGIGITGGGSTMYRLVDLIMFTSIVGGIGVVQSTTVNAVDVIGRDILIIGPTSGAQLTAGFQIQNSGDTTLCRVSTVKCGIGLNLVPQNGQRIQALIVSDSYFDSGSGAGVQANPAAGATIDLLKIANTWTCTNTNGVSLGPSGTGLIKCVEMFNLTMSNHTAGTGLTSTSIVTNLRVVGGSASGNVNGVSIGANQNDFSIIGLRAGPCGEFGANTSTGIVVAAGTSNNYLIMGCDLRGNTSAALTDGGTGTTKYTFGNLGVNPGATVPVAVGASPFTHTAGASPITAYVAGGTVSNITVAGQSTGLGAGSFRVGPRQALVITYTVAPTLVVTTD